MRNDNVIDSGREKEPIIYKNVFGSLIDQGKWLISNENIACKYTGGSAFPLSFVVDDNIISLLHGSCLIRHTFR